MNDVQFGSQVAALLDEGLSRVDQDVLTRLQVARKSALGIAAAPHHVRALAVAGAGSAAGNGGLQHWFAGPRLWFALGMLTLAISGVTLTEFGSDAEADTAADLDLAILADDLPVTAYIDHGFDTWLKRPVEPQQ